MRIVVATVILVLAPRVALACPACVLVGVTDNSTAYVSMSIVLMVLPLGMILGITTWLYRSVRRAEGGARIPAPGRVEDELTIPSRKPPEPVIEALLSSAQVECVFSHTGNGGNTD